MVGGVEGVNLRGYDIDFGGWRLGGYQGEKSNGKVERN